MKAAHFEPLIQEVVFAGAGMIGWMLVCGIGGTISQRTIIETGEYFGWLAVCFTLFMSFCIYANEKHSVPTMSIRLLCYLHVCFLRPSDRFESNLEIWSLRRRAWQFRPDPKLPSARSVCSLLKRMIHTSPRCTIYLHLR